MAAVPSCQSNLMKLLKSTGQPSDSPLSGLKYVGNPQFLTHHQWTLSDLSCNLSSLHSGGSKGLAWRKNCDTNEKMAQNTDAKKVSVDVY
jgi:hypothetical protein